MTITSSDDDLENIPAPPVQAHVLAHSAYAVHTDYVSWPSDVDTEDQTFQTRDIAQPRSSPAKSRHTPTRTTRGRRLLYGHQQRDPLPMDYSSDNYDCFV